MHAERGIAVIAEALTAFAAEIDRAAAALASGSSFSPGPAPGLTSAAVQHPCP
jgi:hypothetical protein